jgi:hypothetical protein
LLYRIFADRPQRGGSCRHRPPHGNRRVQSAGPGHEQPIVHGNIPIAIFQGDFVFAIFKKKPSLTRKKEYLEAPPVSISLKNQFDKLCAGQIDENDFIVYLRAIEIDVNWFRDEVLAANAEKNEKSLYYLLNCLNQNDFRLRDDIGDILHIYCEMMVDPSFAGYAEDVADTLGYCQLEEEALGYFITLCTSPTWEQGGYWPDLRKALESIYAMYERNTCTKDEIIAAFREIIESPATQLESIGLRDSARAFIEMMNGKK